MQQLDCIRVGRRGAVGVGRARLLSVRVPVVEVRKVGGVKVEVTGTHIGTIRKIDGDTVLVSVGKRKTCTFTAQQIRDAIGKVTEWHAKFGEAMPIGGQE